MARQKNVYKTAEIPHLWFHKTQQSARNHGNLFFDGDTIYSYGYHFQIARHVTNERGEAAVLFNSASDSSMTAQHKQHVRRAIPGGYPVFHCNAGRRTDLCINNCLRIMQREFDTTLSNLKSAKSKPSKACKYGEFLVARSSLRNFLDFIGQEYEHLNHALTQAEEADYRQMCDEHDAKVSEARDKRSEASRTAFAAWQMQREEDSKRTIAERIEAWRNGKYTSLPYDTPTMVRINAGTVETSRGATFPLAHAVKGLPLVMAIINGNMEYQRKESDPIIRLGHYTIDNIGNGVLTAGCHNITYDEVRHFAELVNQQKTAAV